MALSKIQAESMNLADTYAFTGTVTGVDAIGQGQTFSNPSRAFTTTYTNTTGRSIFVEIAVYHTSNFQFEVRINGNATQITSGVAGLWGSMSFIVPNGATYWVAASGLTNSIWTELS